jgi:hypothetical protein
VGAYAPRPARDIARVVGGVVLTARLVVAVAVDLFTGGIILPGSLEDDSTSSSGR